MKRTKQCPKCQSLRIGHIARQVDNDERMTGEDPPRLNASTVAPSMRFAGVHSEVKKTGWLDPPTRSLAGPLEAYVCTDCGYHETFVKEPTTVEWDKIVGFSWVNEKPPEGGPFR